MLGSCSRGRSRPQILRDSFLTASGRWGLGIQNMLSSITSTAALSTNANQSGSCSARRAVLVLAIETPPANTTAPAFGSARGSDLEVATFLVHQEYIRQRSRSSCLIQTV